MPPKVFAAAADKPAEDLVPAKADSGKTLDAQRMKEVAALRVKYRIKGGDGLPAPRRNIAPHLVAWHMKNRRGLKPNPARVQQLILSYCGGGTPTRPTIKPCVCRSSRVTRS